MTSYSAATVVVGLFVCGRVMAVSAVVILGALSGFGVVMLLERGGFVLRAFGELGRLVFLGLCGFAFGRVWWMGVTVLWGLFDSCG